MNRTILTLVKWNNGKNPTRYIMNYFREKEDLKEKKDMYKAFQRYRVRTNNIARRVLGFKAPNETVENYFKGIV